jgi:hypothetical protein
MQTRLSVCDLTVAPDLNRTRRSDWSLNDLPMQRSTGKNRGVSLCWHTPEASTAVAASKLPGTVEPLASVWQTQGTSYDPR